VKKFALAVALTLMPIALSACAFGTAIEKMSKEAGKSTSKAVIKTAISPALHNWAVLFYNSSWSSCAPEWNDLKANYNAASGPYGINTTQIIDNDCGSLKGNSPDASLNNLIDTFTSDELNWSIDVVNTGNGMYADDFATLDKHFNQLNARIMQARAN